MFLIDDDIANDLPGTYGVDDLPLIVQDLQFRGGAFATAAEVSPTPALWGIGRWSTARSRRIGTWATN